MSSGHPLSLDLLIGSRSIPARDLARRLGVKTATLAKWRQLGRGPRGWIRVSETFVVYPLDEVEMFLAERVELGRPKKPANPFQREREDRP